MKKLIYTLSLILAGAFAANAAAPLPVFVPEGQPVKDGLHRVRARVEPAVPADQMTPEKFVGSYTWSGFDLLNGQGGHPEKGAMNISIDEENPDQFIIKNFCVYGDLKGTFDAATGHLVIKNQFVVVHPERNMELWFYNYTVVNGVSGGDKVHITTMASPEHPFYFTMREDGMLTAGNLDPEKWSDYTYTDEELENLCCIAALIMPDEDTSANPNNGRSYAWAELNISAKPLRPYEFVADEWEYVGVEEFKDAWFSQYWVDGYVESYEREIYRNKEEPYTFCIMDPYGEGTPYSDVEMTWQPGVVEPINVLPTPGHIIFNIENRQCVVVRPFVYALTMPEERTIAEENLLGYYPANYEGVQYYVNDEDKENIMNTVDANGLYLSSFSPSTRRVTFYNPYVSTSADISSYLQFSTVTSTTQGYVYLPEGYNAAVNEVLVEDGEGEVEYYNLQGVRLANPEKGKIVIVKKGNTASKQIYR